MPTKETTTIASRALATYFLAWMLSDITYIPQMVYSFFHHAGLAGAFDTSAFLSNHDAVSLSFLAVRICALFLAARWFYAGGPAVHEFLMGSSEVEDTPAA